MNIKETAGRDGLRIISCKVPHKRSVAVELISRVGFAYDPHGKQGLFHCFEHMAFKGTKKRSVKELQAFQMKHLFGINASTGALGTTYTAIAIDRKLPQACEYLCDIYFNSTYPSAELEKEKGPVRMEIARRENNDLLVADQALREILYRKNPARNKGGGTADGVESIQRSDLLRQRAKWHVPSNTVAIAVGAVRHDEFADAMNKFAAKGGGKADRKEWSDEWEELPSQTRMDVKGPERNRAAVMVGCKLPATIGGQEREALSIYAKLLGFPGNSRLWNEIREKRGLAYQVGSRVDGQLGLAKYFCAYAESTPANTALVEALIKKSIAKPFVDKAQFADLQERVLESFEVSKAEHGSDYEGMIWEKIAEGKLPREVEREDGRRLRVIKSLTLRDVEKFRVKYLRPERFAAAVVKPER